MVSAIVGSAITHVATIAIKHAATAIIILSKHTYYRSRSAFLSLK